MLYKLNYFFDTINRMFYNIHGGKGYYDYFRGDKSVERKM